MHIPSRVHANSVVRPCKFRRVSMQLRGKDQQQRNPAAILTISEQKSLNLRPMSFPNLSLRNLFGIGLLDFQPL